MPYFFFFLFISPYKLIIRLTFILTCYMTLILKYLINVFSISNDRFLEFTNIEIDKKTWTIKMHACRTLMNFVYLLTLPLNQILFHQSFKADFWTSERHQFYALNTCLSPYRAFLNLSALFSWCFTINPMGCST